MAATVLTYFKTYNIMYLYFSMDVMKGHHTKSEVERLVKQSENTDINISCDGAACEFPISLAWAIKAITPNVESFAELQVSIDMFKISSDGNSLLVYFNSKEEEDYHIFSFSFQIFIEKLKRFKGNTLHSFDSEERQVRHYFSENKEQKDEDWGWMNVEKFIDGYVSKEDVYNVLSFYACQYPETFVEEMIEVPDVKAPTNPIIKAA